MFNDDVQMGFFDVYDQYLVNMLYDPHVRPGMTRDEVSALLPDIFPTVRAWVTNAGSARGEESNNGPGVRQRSRRIAADAPESAIQGTPDPGPASTSAAICCRASQLSASARKILPKMRRIP
jgi:Protein of unknown function (DUF2927)